MKNKIITFTFIIYLLSLAVIHIIIPDKEISTTERRQLKEFPEFTFTSEYISQIDKYLLDHFPLRDQHRSIKAKFNYNILNKLENNNIYLKDSSIYKSNYPTNIKSINNFINKTDKIKSMLSIDNKTYIMVVPDKNYYLKDKKFLHIDYDYIYNEVNKLNIPQIDIRNILSKEDYYQTDTHWKQENLDKVVYQMSKDINFNYEKVEYIKNEYNDFYGVYYGESAVKRKPEKLTYLTNATIDNSKVIYLENKSLSTVYNKENLNSLDPYEVYLDGASSFIEITNTNSKNNKELVIFRDSFGSSIAPLLIEYYSKITLIDNRYITSSNIINNINFTNQDVLFLYSTLIINDSSVLKG